MVNGTQVGIVSFGVTNCSAGWPSVYTRISEFSEWITETIEKFDNPESFEVSAVTINTGLFCLVVSCVTFVNAILV